MVNKRPRKSLGRLLSKRPFSYAHGLNSIGQTTQKGRVPINGTFPFIYLTSYLIFSRFYCFGCLFGLLLALDGPAAFRLRLFCCFKIVQQSFFSSQMNTVDIPISIIIPICHFTNRSRNNSVVNRKLIFLLLFGLGKCDSIGIALFTSSDYELYFLSAFPLPL